MIPLRDANPSSTRPLVTVGLILINCLVFLYELWLPPQQRMELVFRMGMVPARVGQVPLDPEVGAADAFLPLLTSMFLHGGWLHLIGNMWFLWIFGDNLEDRLGHLRFLGFYLIAGLGAGLAHTLIYWSSAVPSIGASGAVAGVLGGYFLLFPGARVLTLIPAFFLFTVELPAFLILLYWFAVQFFSGTAAILARGSEASGVAWWAHIGGFLLGLLLVKGLLPRRRVFPRRPQ